MGCAEGDDEQAAWKRPAKPAKSEFEEIRLIGTGNFCEVVHVMRHTPPEERKAEQLRKNAGLAVPSDGVRDFAMKSVSKEKVKKLRKEPEVVMEKECLLKLNDPAYKNSHPGWHNIIQLYFTTSDKFNVYLLTEFCPDGELWALTTGVGILNRRLCQCYASQIVNALEYIHSRGIVHRDLKAENILVATDGSLRLIDFGTAWDTQRPELKLAGNSSNSSLALKQFQHFVGTANFMAPECVQNKSAGWKSDLWSLGATFYQLAAGKPPFDGPSDFLTHLASKNLLLEFPPHFPSDLEDLVRALMRINPDERLGASADATEGGDLSSVKAHPFFAGVNWQDPLQLLQGEKPLPSLATLCFSHMSREWARFEEKWKQAGWLPREGHHEKTCSEEWAAWEKPSPPTALEMKSREMLQKIRNPPGELVDRLLWWKQLEASRPQAYWDDLVKEFMGQTSPRQASSDDGSGSSCSCK